MKIVLNPFTNKIGLYKPASKKEEPISIEVEANYPLNTPSSCIHALDEFLQSESAEILKKEKTNLLIIPDYPVAFGTFSLPVLSRFKIHDIFETRFKSCYPSFENYYLKYREYHRGDEESLYFYTFAKKIDVTSILSAFKKTGIHITSTDYFAHHVTSNLEKKDNYPTCFLFVGESCSEFVLCKGAEVLSMVMSNQGEKAILNASDYVESPYFSDNVRAKKYSAFMKESLITKKELNDASIESTPISDLEHPKPRALRMLKGHALEAYLVKNGIKKYLSFVGDLINYFALDPWFIPISEIKVFSTDNFYNQLIEHASEYVPFVLERVPKSFDDIISLPGKNNSLFRKSIKKERRTIDWSKFFSMSIGPKKKA